MSFLSLYMNAGQQDRLSIAATCFLGVVSWQFILVSSTPAIGYATRMDVFLVMSLLFITGMYTWNVIHVGMWGAIDEAEAELGNAADAAAEDQTPGIEYSHAAEASKPARLRTLRGVLCCLGCRKHIHKNLDILMFWLLCIGYIIASWAIMMMGLKSAPVPDIKREILTPVTAGDF
jgi:hypothetical protein